MDKMKKKSVKRYILWGVLAFVVLALALMPLMARQQQEEDGPQASILSANAAMADENALANAQYVHMINRKHYDTKYLHPLECGDGGKTFRRNSGKCS